MLFLSDLLRLIAKPEYIVSKSCQIPGLKEKWEAIFGRRAHGTFVEVGAFDGESFSNTSCLADAGWTGLYIEPIPEFARKCRARHENNKRISVLEVAASDRSGLSDIFVGGVLTTLEAEQVNDYSKIDWAKHLHEGRTLRVETERLDVILRRGKVRRHFDLLVVDVEGAEKKVMDAFNIDFWRPKAILIELEDEHPDFVANERIVASARSVREKIETAGYSLFFKDAINSLYVRG